jgi:hypothetical protein
MNLDRRPAFHKLPLWRDANHCLLLIEQAVRDFPRYHKYAVGADLRQLAMQICRLVARAAQCTDALQRLRLVETLAHSVDDLKIAVTLAKELRAFASFNQFQAIAECAVALGKQSGGWWKRARTVAAAPGPAMASVAA